MCRYSYDEIRFFFDRSCFVCQIDLLQQIKERAALLEREKESLNFVVENKSHFERYCVCMNTILIRLSHNSS